jgi:hypothetical protein
MLDPYLELPNFLLWLQGSTSLLDPTQDLTKTSGAEVRLRMLHHV